VTLPHAPGTALSPYQAPRVALTAVDVEADLARALGELWARLESPHSRRAYREDWRRWTTWLTKQDVHPLAATARQVQDYLAWLQVQDKAKSTRARALAVLRGSYATLVVAFSRVEGVCKHNPAREAHNIRTHGDPNTPWLNEDELRRLLVRPQLATWRNRRDWLILATLVGTGLRRAEVARLHQDQLLPVEGGYSARVRAKGGKDAYVVLPAWLCHELDQWFKSTNDGPLFPRYPMAAQAVCAGTVYSAVKAAAIRASLDLERCTPHAIRRSVVTLLGQKGVSLKDRQNMLLHTSQATTERYDKTSKLPAQAPGEVLASLIEEE